MLCGERRNVIATRAFGDILGIPNIGMELGRDAASTAMLRIQFIAAPFRPTAKTHPKNNATLTPDDNKQKTDIGRPKVLVTRHS